MKDLTVILPIHRIEENDKKLIHTSVMIYKSMKEYTKDVDVKLSVVGPKDVLAEFDKIVEDIKTEYTKIENNGKTDFCSQINFAVEKCETEFFSILEFDDFYNEKWINMAKPYIDANPKVSVYLPMIEMYDNEKFDLGPVNYINEIAWSSSFANENEMGHLGVEELLSFYEFNLTGSIIRTNDFIKCGGLKPSIKISFGYEFLLRVANKNKGIFVVPKVGYFHVVNRKGSLTDTYVKEISQEEGSWWIELATKEYLFKKDRNKTYEDRDEESENKEEKTE